MASYIPPSIGGYPLTYSAESLVWHGPNDVIEERLANRGISQLFNGAIQSDVFSFDGWVADADVSNMMTLREKKRFVTFKANILGKRFTNPIVFAFIEDVILNEQRGFTGGLLDSYPYKFRLRKVAEYDNYARATIFNLTTLTTTFNLTAKPVVVLPILDGALKFNGTNQYCLASSPSTNLNLTGSTTFELYVNPTNFTNVQTLISKGNSGGTQKNFEVTLDTSGHVLFTYTSGAGATTHTYTTTTQPLTAGAWNSIQVSYTFGTGSSMQVYVNGGAWTGPGLVTTVATGSWTSGTGNSAPDTATQQLVFAAKSSIAGYFVGSLSNIAVRTALAATNGSDAYSSYIRQTPLLDSHTVGYWQLSEWVGSTNYDASGSNTKMTMTGTPTFSTGQTGTTPTQLPTGVRNGQYGGIPYITSPLSSSVAYNVTDYDLDYNIVNSGVYNGQVPSSGGPTYSNETYMSNGLIMIVTRTGQSTNKGAVDLYYYNGSNWNYWGYVYHNVGQNTVNLIDSSSNNVSLTMNNGYGVASSPLIRGFGVGSGFSTAYVSTPAITNMPTGAFTFECWLNFKALPASGTSFIILDQNHDSTHRSTLQITNTSGTYSLQWVAALNGASTTYYNHNLTTPTVNTTIHIALSYDGTSTLYGWQNGVALGSTAFSTAIPSLNAALAIGNTATSPTVSVPLIQGATQGLWSSGSTITVTLGSAPINGDTLILTCATQASGSAVTVSSITQTGVSWVVAKAANFATNLGDVEIWYGKVSSGAGTSITVNLSGTPLAGIVDVVEYPGLTASPVDQSATANNTTATGTTSSGTTAATTNNFELIVAAINSASTANQTAPTNSFTLMDGVAKVFGSNNMSLAMLHNVSQNATATWTTGTSVSVNSTYIGVICSFIVTPTSAGNSMDDFRVSNTARYTAAFTPPTQPLTSDANTVILIGFEPFIYNNTSNQTVTAQIIDNDDSEYADMQLIWNSFSNGQTLLAEYEIFKGRPYFDCKLSNIGSTNTDSITTYIYNTNNVTGNTTLGYSATSTSNAYSGYLASATTDNHNYIYLSNGAIAAGKVAAYVFTTEKVNGRTYVAYVDSTNSYWQLVGQGYGSGMSTVKQGNDFFQFWVGALLVNTAAGGDDDPAQLALESISSLTTVQDVQKVT